jgi:hypothetical protein
VCDLEGKHLAIMTNARKFKVDFGVFKPEVEILLIEISWLIDYL